MQNTLQATIVKILIFVFITCNVTNVKAQKINSDGIPPDFKCSGCILLIIKKDKGELPLNYNKYIEKNFKKDYSGEYEMVTWEDLDSNAKYQDKSIYKFVLSDQMQKDRTKTTLAKGFSGGRETSYTYSVGIKYQIYHREENKSYPNLGHFTNSAKAIKEVAEALDKKLKD